MDNDEKKKAQLCHPLQREYRKKLIKEDLNARNNNGARTDGTRTAPTLSTYIFNMLNINIELTESEREGTMAVENTYRQQKEGHNHEMAYLCGIKYAAQYRQILHFGQDIQPEREEPAKHEHAYSLESKLAGRDSASPRAVKSWAN